jgi:hypothetical protein
VVAASFELQGAIELEVVDADTGERLAAAIDDRLVLLRARKRATG